MIESPPDARSEAPIELAPDERERLLGRYGRKFGAGDALFREGEPATEAFLLQDGRVRLLKRVRAVERSLMVLKPGDLFGESALLEVASHNSTAIALTDVAAVVLDKLTRRVRDAEDQIEIMMVKDTHSKIVSVLLKLVQRTPLASGGVELAVSPVELSTRVGLDVETVKAGVQRLREQGYVRIVGERIDIPDVEALRRLYLLLGTKEELRGE